MIGSVSSKSNELSMLDGSITSKDAAQNATGEAFGQTLKQSLDQQQDQKIQKNQSLSASRSGAQNETTGPGNSQNAENPVTQNKPETAVSTPASSGLAKSDSPEIPNQTTLTLPLVGLPPGNPLPLLQDEAEAGVSGDLFNLPVPSVSEEEVSSSVHTDVHSWLDSAWPPVGSKSTEDQPEHGSSNDVQLPESAAVAWQNPLINPTHQNPAGQVLPDQAISRFPSSGLPLESVPGVDRATLQSVVRAPVGSVDASQHPVTQNPANPGLNLNLSLNSEASAQAQATWLQAGQGLRTALDKMPESVSQKVDTLNPFSAVLQGATDVKEPEQMVTLRLDRALTHARWAQDLGERVQWMVNRAMNGAEIRLNPPQLGPIEVRIQMQQEQANVAFTAHHAHVRDAIESAIPKLREMLSQQSLNLVNVDISQHSFAEQRQHSDGLGAGGRSQAGPFDTAIDGELLDESSEPMALPIHNGLINTYA